MVNATAPKAVIAMPEACIAAYQQTLCIVGNCLQSQGWQLMALECDGFLSFCNQCSALHCKHEDCTDILQKICPVCKKNFKTSQKKYAFDAVRLKDVLPQEKKAELDKLVEDNMDNLEALTYCDINFGKLTQYAFCLQFKLVYSGQSDLKEGFIAHLRYALYSFAIAQHVIAQQRPELFLLFNSYSHCLAVKKACDLAGVRCVFFTTAAYKNADCSAFMPYSLPTFLMELCALWPTVRNMPALADNVGKCWADAVYRAFATGSHIYSLSAHGNPEYIYKLLMLEPQKRLVVAYSSSGDERLGHDIMKDALGLPDITREAFKSQLEWLKDLKAWAESRNDVHVVVRTHPREGVNKNYPFRSKAIEELEREFPENSSAFTIIWPEEKISSYLLMEIADAVVVPWTTMGMEAARLGVPVLSWAANMYYTDDDFIQVKAEYADYRQALDALPYRETSWNCLARAVRYSCWRTFASVIDLGATVPSELPNGGYWAMPPDNMKALLADIAQGKINVVEENKKAWLTVFSGDDDAALKAEAEANMRGIRFLLENVFYPPALGKTQALPLKVLRRLCRILAGKVPRCLLPVDPFKPVIEKFEDYNLLVEDDASHLQEFIASTLADRNLSILLLEDSHYVQFIRAGKAHRRMSVAVARLGRLLQQRA